LLQWLVLAAIFLAWISGNRSGGLNVGTRIAAGLTTGALAVLLAQPTDVVKVRFQAQQRALGTGTAPRYKSTLQAYQTIARQEGARGLWKGEPHYSFSYKT
jgi:solute carrier family 25 uncoupling protein 8/9